MAGGATAVQGWPTANRGYRTVMRNVDAEQVEYRQRRPDLHVGGHQDRGRTRDGGTPHGRRCRVHLPLRRRPARARACCATTPTSTTAEGLLPTLIAHPLLRRRPRRTGRSGPRQNAGGVVWSPLSNLVLYAQTTLIDDARARGVRVCLGSDWGPSGTKNLLGEMKVARLVADQLGYTLTDREIVEMVTTNPGVLLERCWHRPVGRLVEGAFADITVLSGRGSGSAWKRIVAATERDVALVVIDGVPRYGYASLMDAGGRAADLHDDRGRTQARRRPARSRRRPRSPGHGRPSGHARGRPAGPAEGDQRRAGPRRSRDHGSRRTPPSSCSWTCPTPVAEAGPAHPRTPPP